MNVIVRLEIELACYDFAVQRFNHYTKRTPTYNTLGAFSVAELFIKLSLDMAKGQNYMTPSEKQAHQQWSVRLPFQ